MPFGHMLRPASPWRSEAPPLRHLREHGAKIKSQSQPSSVTRAPRDSKALRVDLLPVSRSCSRSGKSYVTLRISANIKVKPRHVKIYIYI